MEPSCCDAWQLATMLDLINTCGHHVTIHFQTHSKSQQNEFVQVTHSLPHSACSDVHY